MPSSACTPTPDIYPLSLHDALPIYELAGHEPVRERHDAGSLFEPHVGHEPRRQSPVHGADVTERVPRGLGSRVDVDLFSNRSHGSLDRKSTRLNSSHPSISYAVFCLHADPRHLPSFPTRRSSDL